MKAVAIDRFIEHWQRGSWSVASLPAQINARVSCLEFGVQLLGCCDVRQHHPSTIVINAALIGTPYYVPVLAHECAHVLLEEDGQYACQITGDEPEVWHLAARLTIPAPARQALRDGNTCAESIAACYELPEAFVRYATTPEQLPAWLDSLVVPPPPP